MLLNGSFAVVLQEPDYELFRMERLLNIYAVCVAEKSHLVMSSKQCRVPTGILPLKLCCLRAECDLLCRF